MKKKFNIGVIGLGYVGLPLALKLGKFFNVVGYDTSNIKVKNLKKGIDINKEVKKKEFRLSKKLIFTTDKKLLQKCNVYIITVPTPIFKNKRPDLRLIKNATEAIAKLIAPGDIVIYESTVYPGLTEEYCVPILKKFSKLDYNLDKKNSFFCGYCPERINFGDKKRKIGNINKLISGSNNQILKEIYFIYSKIINARIIKTQSIIVAEAAKIIENIQRDVNIGLINELAMIFDKMKINTQEVLKAASTKWNFLNFKPGLVGGHCIGIDPYYLNYKSKKMGIVPKIILAGRNVNEETVNFIYKKFLSLLQSKKLNTNKSKILALGCTFKENISDIRNSKALELIYKLKKKFQKVDVYDPHAQKFSNFTNFTKIKLKYDAIILLVKHNDFKNIEIKKLKKLTKKNSIIFDLHSLYPKKYIDGTF